MWEVMSFGEIPYWEMSNQTVSRLNAISCMNQRFLKDAFILKFRPVGVLVNNIAVVPGDLGFDYWYSQIVR